MRDSVREINKDFQAICKQKSKRLIQI